MEAESEEKQSGKRKALTIVQIVLALLIVAGAAWLVVKLVGYWQAQQIYRDIESAYASETDEGFTVDFDALREQYPDVVAWIKMDDVDISYPIVQGDDNEHYLHYDPADQPSVSGSIFLDSRNKSLDTDLYALIYGHNMRDESMFGQLDEYVSQEFYDRGTDAFTIYTPDGKYRYQIFAADIVDPTSEVYTQGFTNAQVFDAFVQQLQDDSMYETGVEATGNDHVITLSTCSSSNRLVLSAKRV